MNRVYQVAKNLCRICAKKTRLEKTIDICNMYACSITMFFNKNSEPCTVKKELKCIGDSEIVHEIVRDTTRKSEEHELICVV